MTRLHVEHPGALALVEDLGRPGFSHLGVAASGALDRGALALANRLVGNADGAAALELVVGGFRARFEDE
jgi:allophanate hydrolase subunit 2